MSFITYIYSNIWYLISFMMLFVVITHNIKNVLKPI